MWKQTLFHEVIQSFDAIELAVYCETAMFIMTKLVDQQSLLAMHYSIKVIWIYLQTRFDSQQVQVIRLKGILQIMDKVKKNTLKHLSFVYAIFLQHVGSHSSPLPSFLVKR